jgi:hypothetical protein
MRKIMLSLVVLGGVAGAGAATQAAPIATAPMPDNPAQIQTVPYHAHGPVWRERQEWQRRRYEALRHHRPHGRAYGYYNH